MTETFQYRGSYFGARKLSADTIAAELASIKSDGDLTADRVVEAAAPEDAPLHLAFTWEDGIAACQYRLIEARKLIRAIVRVPEGAEGEKRPPVSVFVHVPDRALEKPGVYVYMDETLLEKPGEYAMALTELKRKLDAAESAFHELRRLSEGTDTKVEAMAIAIQGFNTVQQAIALLQAA